MTRQLRNFKIDLFFFGKIFLLFFEKKINLWNFKAEPVKKGKIKKKFFLKLLSLKTTKFSLSDFLNSWREFNTQSYREKDLTFSHSISLLSSIFSPIPKSIVKIQKHLLIVSRRLFDKSSRHLSFSRLNLLLSLGSSNIIFIHIFHTFRQHICKLLHQCVMIRPQNLLAIFSWGSNLSPICFLFTLLFIQIIFWF